MGGDRYVIGIDFGTLSGRALVVRVAADAYPDARTAGDAMGRRGSRVRAQPVSGPGL
jgi:ribulose kinase